MRKDEFFVQVAHAMSGCQAVEQGLKLYLTEAFEAVRLRVAPLMPFKMSGKDYENAPLERLIEVFAKFTNDDELVKDLRKFKDERNYLSHRAIAECLDPTGHVDFQALEDFEPRLKAIGPEAERLGAKIYGLQNWLSFMRDVEGVGKDDA